MKASWLQRASKEAIFDNLCTRITISKVSSITMFAIEMGTTDDHGETEGVIALWSAIQYATLMYMFSHLLSTIHNIYRGQALSMGKCAPSVACSGLVHFRPGFVLKVS